MDKKTKKKLNETLADLCNYWDKRKKDLKTWEVRKKDKRLQYHIVINYWGTHHGYLVFKAKVTQPDAEKVLDPIMKRLAKDNKGGQCKAFVREVDLTKLLRTLDLEKTLEAND